MNTKKAILLVEDDSVDAMTVKRALKELNITNQLDIVTDGEKALEYLERWPKPQLILLDINMPKMNGIDFLRIVKKDEEFKAIPVVILTTSKVDQDRTASFKLGASGYMAKPVEYKAFLEVLRIIDLYWTTSESPF